MKRGNMPVARAMIALALAAVVLLPACGGGGGSSGGNEVRSGEEDLFVKKLLLTDADLKPIGGNGTTNAFRDTRILIVFNTAVDFDTVNDRTVRIGVPTGNGLFLEAPGLFQPVAGHPNQVVFNPTKTKFGVDHPFGLDGNAVYEITIPSVTQAEKVVRNRAGEGLVKGHTAQFRTSGQYLQTLSQPDLVSTVPAQDETGVGATSDIIFEFSEPMKPESFILNQTVFVRNLTTDREILGTLRFSADAKKVTFRPVFGYGTGPYVIFARVSRDVTNLSGNPIPKEVRLQFTTTFDAAQPDFGEITENFDTNDFEDTAFVGPVPPAAWNKGVTSGFLAGTFTAGTVELMRGSNTYTWPPWAWGQGFTEHWQALYSAKEIGGPRLITGFEWYKQAYTASTNTSITINMGHTKQGSLTTNLAGNFSDTPVNVLSSLPTYNIVTGNGWYTGPAFTGVFPFNGQDNVILEIHTTNGTNMGYQNPAPSTAWIGLWRTPNTGSTQLAAYTVPTFAGLPGGTSTGPYYMDTRFSYLIDQSAAQSRFYDSGVKSPQFLEPVIFPAISEQPGGTSTTLLFQGAPEDPQNPGNPDLETLSVWTPDLDALSGFRFIRFGVELKANGVTNQVPSYDYFILPFLIF